MSDFEIVGGDLPLLASRTSVVVDEVSGINFGDAMAQAPSAMPGSSSAGQITSAASAMDERRTTLATKYEDFVNAVNAAQAAYDANEGNVGDSFRSAGVVDPAAGQTAAGIQERMEP